MSMEAKTLQELLEKLRAVLTQYEQQERELRQALDQVVQAKLMQAGAVRGVEMALRITDSPDSADGTD